jgi:hypothetical protein
LPLLAQQRWREAAVEANKVIAVSAWDYTAHVRLRLRYDMSVLWGITIVAESGELSPLIV